MREQFAVLVVLVFVGGTLAGTCELQIKCNNLGPIWIGTLGDVGHSTPSNGGFIINPGQELSLLVPSDWSGKLWARTWCDHDINNKYCRTGDCGNKIECAGAGPTPPVTTVHFRLRSGINNIDEYEISLEEGYNIPVSVTPIDGKGDCKTVACPSFYRECPEQLQSTIFHDNEDVIVACHSSCTKFNIDQYCCNGAFSNVRRCNPLNWALNSAQFFKKNCPNARSYAFDEQTYKYTCLASKYRLEFSD